MWIVILQGKLRGVYTCASDAASRIKQLGGGRIVVAYANADVD